MEEDLENCLQGQDFYRGLLISNINNLLAKDHLQQGPLTEDGTAESGGLRFFLIGLAFSHVNITRNKCGGKNQK